MKTTLLLLLLMGSIGAAQAQDADYSNDQPADYVIPAVVYNAPVIYNAPVVYNAPVAYYAPVYYGLPAASCALNACASIQDNVVRSTVTYIGGGHVGYQVSRCNSGSTVTFIGGQSRFH